MSEYTEIGSHQLGRIGADGTCIKTKDFNVLKEVGLHEEVRRLVEEHMSSDEVDTSDTGNDYTDAMECDYSTYTEMIFDLLTNGTTYSPVSIPDIIFSELVKNGFVSNGLIRQCSYYLTKYDSYYMSNSKFSRAKVTDEVLVNTDELIKLLISSGQIKEIG